MVIFGTASLVGERFVRLSVAIVVETIADLIDWLHHGSIADDSTRLSVAHQVSCACAPILLSVSTGHANAEILIGIPVAVIIVTVAALDSVLAI